MPGQPLKVGPFVGGQNTYSDPTAIGDTEALEITNFDVDIDGSLVTRPPIVKENDPPSQFTVRLLGWFTWTTGARYLIAAVIDPAGTTSTLVYDPVALTWSTITTTFAATAMVQYQNKAHLIAHPTEADPGGNWDPTAGFTAVAAMKKGVTACVYKERIFVGEGGQSNTSSRLWFCVAGTPATWNASDFIDVKAGDGQSIVDIITYSDAITIFKQNSTYILAYDSKVSGAQVRLISGTIGVAGRDCVIEYENSLYLLHGKEVYQVTNWNYSKINLKVPLEFVNSHPSDLLTPFNVSQINDRMILRYYDKYYIWGLKTRIWVEWATSAPPLGKFMKIPTDSLTATTDVFLATGQWKKGLTNAASMYSFMETFTAPRTETINWVLVTKSYDFEAPYTYKRLFWWGVDIISKSSLLAQVFPISYGRKITWAQARTRTWAQARAFTWARGADIAVNVDTSVSVTGTVDRTFIKLLKSLRFRQVNFKFSGTNQGNASTAPMRIFAITLFVDTKEKVVAKVT